jgi:hypothetical protein
MHTYLFSFTIQESYVSLQDAVDQSRKGCAEVAL